MSLPDATVSKRWASARSGRKRLFWSILLLASSSPALGPGGTCWAEAAGEGSGDHGGKPTQSGNNQRNAAAARAILQHETSPPRRAIRALGLWATGASAAAAAGVAGYFGVPAEAQLALSFDGGATVAPYLVLTKELTRWVVASAGAAFAGLAVVPLTSSWWRGTRFARAAEFYAQSSGGRSPRVRSPTTLAALVLAGSFAAASGAGIVVNHLEPRWWTQSRTYVQAQVAGRIDATRVVLAPIEQVPIPRTVPPAPSPREVEPGESPIATIAAKLRASASQHLITAGEAVADTARAVATKLAKDTPLEGPVAAALATEHYVPRGGLSAPAGTLLLLGAAAGSGAALTGLRRRFAEGQYRGAAGRAFLQLSATAAAKHATR